MTLSGDIATLAESIVNTLTQTDYQHVDKIDPSVGIYDCDCNGFAAHVLQKTAPEQYASIPKEPQQPRPRAFEYFNFFATLTPDSSGGWHRVDKLEDADRGDILAWRSPSVERGEDTGHVVILAAPPLRDPSGSFFVVHLYDSAAKAHFDDSRMPNGKPSPTGTTGVGSGLINMLVDGEGRPIAYLFAPPADAEYSYRPIAIGRAEPL